VIDTVPFIQLRAAATRGRRADTLPLRGNIAGQLREVRGDAVDTDQVFPAIPTLEQFKGGPVGGGNTPLKMNDD
jgi:hypothetical protein